MQNYHGVKAAALTVRRRVCILHLWLARKMTIGRHEGKPNYFYTDENKQ
jgi:hypothetical protein